MICDRGIGISNFIPHFIMDVIIYPCWLHRWGLGMDMQPQIEDLCWYSNIYIYIHINKKVDSLRTRQDGRHFTDDKCIFLTESVRILIQISVTFVYKCAINNETLYVQIMAYCTDAHMRRSDSYISKLILQLRRYKFARYMTRWNEIFAAHAA